MAWELLERQSTVAANNPSLLHDPNWLATTDRALNALQYTLHVFTTKRTVPPDMQPIDAGYHTMASEIFVLVMYYPDGVNAVDPSQLERADNNINQLKATATLVQQEIDALRAK